jgi:hypothetical protein
MGAVQVMVRVKDEEYRGFFAPVGDEGFRHVIMPMR